jgi:hypothetical protein
MMKGGILALVCYSAVAYQPRLFHPAFPLEVLTPLSTQEVQEVVRVRDLLKSGTSGDDFTSSEAGLPWKPLPRLGVTNSQGKMWSRREIAEAYERNRHLGHLVWAEKLTKPERGCILLNHWKQSAVYLVEYSPEQGARGFEIRTGSGSTDFITWPPLALEMELADKKWQPVCVSDNISNGSILQLLPAEMDKAPWELILLLLLDPAKHSAELQALFDTGLSPKKGLIAYMRLLEQVLKRAEEFDDVPDYLKISESEIPV